MLRTIAPAEMKRVEMRVMAETSITGEKLMQAAAAHVARAVQELCQGKKGMVVCICGAGNNGGDGLAAMRMLAQASSAFWGECWMLPGVLSSDAKRELERLVNETPQIRVRWLEKESWPEVRPICAIDAMFGTGLTRPLEGISLAMCRQMNRWDAPVVAVDIPSGLSGLTGEVLGEAVKAVKTITFHRPKHGLYLGEGPDYAGEIVSAEIGLNQPEAVRYDDADGFFVLEKSDLLRLLPKRKRVSHKGSYGKVLLWAGSFGMAGAAAIAAAAALRTGAGLVAIACPEKIVDTVQTLCPCATCVPLSADAEEAWKALEQKLEWADALGAGCGLGTGPWAEALLNKLLHWLKAHDLPAVLDADALNLLAKQEKEPIGLIVTPHPAEAARLLHTSVSAVLADPCEAAAQLAERYGAAVLKGACSLLCDGEKRALNPFGTPAMAKGGSGDALTGIIAALLVGRKSGVYFMTDLELMQTACALHGLAGEMAAERFGERGMLATDLCDCIGLVEGEPKQNESPALSALGRHVTVVVEHSIGSCEENNTSRVYPFNTGYVQEVLDEKNEWQDACICGIDHPIEWFEGVVKAVANVQGREIWLVAQKDWMLDQDEMNRKLPFFGDVERFETEKQNA